MKLDDQVAMITGASSGIGRGVAHEFDRAGMKQPLEPGDIARCVRFMLEQPPHVSIPRMMVLPSEQAM